ncbi:MAG: 50S ribosomal protein L17 [Candidatus Omnitrophica bacterium]|nr:50S ribosomal protein L17 [Candidatus Omnitrophota bacterium]
MRHNITRNQLNRFSSWRKATLSSLARNMLLHQSIKTTEARAKAARPVIEELITLAKNNTLAAKRQAFKTLNDHRLVKMLFTDIGPRFANRASGFTRILHMTQRRGDNARMVIFELTEIKKIERKASRKKQKSKEQELQTQQPVPSADAGQAEGREEKHSHVETLVKEKPPVTKKPTKNFLGGLKGIFKKERDSL